MYILDPLFKNSTGSAFSIKNPDITGEVKEKIQLQIGDIAIYMDIIEIKAFLTVIRSAKKGCQCKDCNCKAPYKTIKCNTPHAEINFKLTPEILDGLEELVLGILFYGEYDNILKDNSIKNMR
ncbi:hypothetical protein [Aquimarina algiphila]|uniref:Uncharacterized protein n=1 Tax=Aquimarina algiphila TaxID=2047982 RepID=A0A554VPJ8_9FLAO|nr:hypothetical protein [Aquimarina algiphila]TSE10393.1 hypothetical protein FOF46_04990 [Aquimarina algiphila]